jgi:hypothetical protein
MIPAINANARSRGLVVAFAVACLGLCACQRGTPSAGETAATVADAPAHADSSDKQAGTPAKEDAADGVTLTPEQIAKLGLVVQPALSIQHREETPGYGVVISHDIVAQVAADQVTAQAAARLSRSALARAKRLSGTPGAVSADVEETAAQKAEIDAAALTATDQKLSSILGMSPPWKIGDKDSTLQALASGRIKLVRVTFPLGAFAEGRPASFRATRIGVSHAIGWTMTAIWDAPADVSVPGRSFFALLKRSDATEGERLQVWAPIGESMSGVIVPAAAVVMSQGKYWCYLQPKPGTFLKTEIDAGRPVTEGYFVTDGVKAGDEIAVTAVGQLLAKESGSAAEPD